MWQSSYESTNDFKSGSGSSWYVEDGSSYASHMDTSMEVVRHGVWSHKHVIDSARDVQNDTGAYKPHRAYVVIDLTKADGISYMGRALIQIYVYTDLLLQERVGTDDWFSLATLSCDSSDNWRRTILVNLTTDGYIRLVHVPGQGEQTHTFQMSSSNNPSGNRKWKNKQWNRVDIYLDTDSLTGEAIVWQNQIKVSSANVRGCSFGDSTLPYLVQAHFGMYSPATMATGVVYNDKLRLIEVANDSVAQVLVNEPW